MNGKLVKIACLAVVSTAIAGVVLAQERGPGPRGGDRPAGGGGGGGGSHDGGKKRGPTSRTNPDQLFDRFDADHNGAWSREEFKEFFSRRPPPPPRDDDRPPPRDGDRPPPRN